MANHTTLSIVIGIIALLLVGSCTGGNTVSLQTFLGGNDGITISFTKDSPPTEVFDGGGYPFGIEVKLDNKGETLVPKDLLKVSINGIRAQEFGLLPDALVKTASDDALERKVDSTGKVTEPGPIFVAFENLNHVVPITGNQLQYPIRAEVCYYYATKGATSLCVRKNLANPAEGGLCEIDSTRPLSTSGAPVQIQSVTEFKRGKDSVGFNFDITTGTTTTAKPYAKGSRCEGGRASENRVFVKVNTDVPGLTCTGLSPSREGAVEGTIQVYEGTRTVSCQQKMPSTGDFEMPVTIELQYDYQDYVETTLTVKHTSDE